MIIAWELHKLGTRDVIGNVVFFASEYGLVSRPVDDERGDVDRRKYVANVEVQVHPPPGDFSSRTRSELH